MVRQSLVVAAVAVAVATGFAAVKETAYDMLIAHRGESKDAPENTLLAFSRGADTVTTNSAKKMLDEFKGE